MINENLYSQANYLDLRGIPCPVNHIRSSLAIEELSEKDFLTIDLDKGEPYMMVSNGLSTAGHEFKIILDDDSWVRILVNGCAK